MEITNIINLYNWFNTKTIFKASNYEIIEDALLFEGVNYESVLKILNVINENLEIELKSIWFDGVTLIIKVKL